MKNTMSVEVAVANVEEAIVVSDFLHKHFHKEKFDVLICSEHPFPTAEDLKEEDPE